MTQRLDWQTEHLRFSFLGCTDAAGEMISWKSIVGQEADSVTVKKSQGLRNEDGAWGAGQLSVNAQPGRVDVLVSAHAMLPTPDLPDFGSLEGVADKLLGHFLDLKMPKCARLAVGARLNYHVSSSAEALDVMNKLLPLMSIDRESHDVVFQENKPKKLKHSGVVLNRVYKWSQVRVQFLQIAVQADGTQQMIQPSTDSAQFMLQLELDFNTAPSSVLPHVDSYGKIVEEMFALLKQAAEPQGV